MMPALRSIDETRRLTVDQALRRELIEAVAHTVIEHADELTALDQAVGDGDHGINMKRGFEAVLAELDGSASKSLPEALKAIGLTLVMKVGGASGPLYGTLFMTLGKELPEAFSVAELAMALDRAISAVMARGKSAAGEKTMLDVLVPAQKALASGQDVRSMANKSAQATVPMRATRGRASFLGERSIGCMDPGARSSALMISAVADVVERRI